MNLGNCWLKRDEVAKAILNYERAYLIDPSDPDIRFNLELARTKTVDKVNPVNQLFIVVWFKKMLSLLDVDGWAVLTVGRSQLRRRLCQSALRSWLVACVESIDERSEELTFAHRLPAIAIQTGKTGVCSCRCRALLVRTTRCAAITPSARTP